MRFNEIEKRMLVADYNLYLLASRNISIKQSPPCYYWYENLGTQVLCCLNANVEPVRICVGYLIFYSVLRKASPEQRQSLIWVNHLYNVLQRDQGSLLTVYKSLLALWVKLIKELWNTRIKTLFQRRCYFTYC